jgi:hypothetical protein
MCHVYPFVTSISDRRKANDFQWRSPLIAPGESHNTALGIHTLKFASGNLQWLMNMNAMNINETELTQVNGDGLTTFGFNHIRSSYLVEGGGSTRSSKHCVGSKGTVSVTAFLRA